MKGLHPHVQVEQLPVQAIKNIAPVILGAPAWTQIRDQAFTDWGAFKALVEEHFGLTAEMEQAQFFAMRPVAGQSDASFVLKVESTRKLNRLTTQGLEHTFLPRLTPYVKVLDLYWFWCWRW